MDAAEFVQRYSTRYLIDALGFEKHMRQIRERRGDTIPPVWYKRPYSYSLWLEDNKIKGHRQTAYFPTHVVKPDYEFEIAGFFTEAIKTDDVQEAVEFVKTKMWFTIFCDFSSRDLQAEDMKLPLSVSPSKGVADKSFGPVWVPGDSLVIDDNGVLDMRMKLWVGGLRCDDNFQSIYFDDPETGRKRCWGFAQVISWFGKMNQGFARGHILGSGTIGNGSIAELFHKYPWLKEGDVIVMEARGIGTLESEIGIKTSEV